MNTAELKDILNKNKKILKSKYQVKKIGVFGSYIHNTHTENSDIDCLVELGKGVDLFLFVDLKEKLTELFHNKKVDLVTSKALKKRIRKKILEEVQWV